jgi:predicted anti-sigma-YlaC factor YlaD
MLTFSLTDCDRARESVSAELDGELPELERERLLAHLRACAGCSAWAAEVEDSTLLLREASLEAPVGSIALPRRARRWTVGPAVAVSSAAALVASVVVAIGPQSASLGTQSEGPLGSEPAQTAPSHPLGGAKLFTGHPVGVDNQLAITSLAPEAKSAFGAAVRVPS